ncbi:hypothetical protein DYB37_012834 [Aphanomyces astaci]|uniref:HTH psq-type domain-containing protein n=1 Tax=Aphanomyces astaci TaxID=112090 RepID=A0A3R6WTU9_APHAT|nr:hypothetical protein DYB35_012405 [Aphanomyces astaci]RHZ34161.1 hypothetical protein DYB37_012834 [Aphanomyces astaci]
MPDEGHLAPPQSIKRRIRPSIAQKLNAIAVAERTTVREAASTLGFPEGYIPSWMANQAKLKRCRDVKATKQNTGKSGAIRIIPDVHGLVTYMKDLRRQEMAVTSSHMLQYLRVDQLDWIEHYMRSRRSGYHSLRLLQHFAERHGFWRQRICHQKKSQEELEATRIAFGKQFHDKHPAIDMDVLYNSDETGMYYDMCSKIFWAIRGGGSYVANSKRHSYRMTVLLTVRGDGKK